jgi:putative sterol carrier protein
MNVRIQTENNQFVLAFNENIVELFDFEEDQNYDVELEGSYDTISSILTGELKLRQAARTNDLLIRASYRKLLLLESIFYLSKPYRVV